MSRDERESDVRRTLNYGHTLGHAIESVTGYRRFRHGEAIAYGMVAMANLAHARGILGKSQADAISELVGKLGPLPSVSDLSSDSILETVRRDKKVLRGKLHVVLPTRIGATKIINDVTKRELVRALKSIGIRSAT